MALQYIVFLVNFNLYESKRHFTQKLSEAFKRKGIKTKIIDVKEQTIDASIGLELQRDPPDLTCSFNAFIPNAKHQYLWDILKIPNLSILVDPALYSVGLTNSPFSYISCVDRFECDALKSTKFDRVFFLPHAVEKELQVGPKTKKYDVVYLGSCIDYEGLEQYWKQHYPKAVDHVLKEASQLVLSSRSISLAQALVTAYQASNLGKENVNFMELFYFLDNYTRGKDRVELIRSIKNVPIHVFGELVTDHPAFTKGWTHYLGKQKNVTVHPSVPFQKGLDILQHSKICLNSMPFFKNGSHERVFTGLATGAVPITTHSLYWQECFQDNQELLFYFPGNCQEVNDKVQHLLSSETKRLEMAALGRQKVMQHHTWDNRVEELLSRLELLNHREQ